jgi:TPP-dependent pyruvate/acetoin dehydrogenase alpha subunit
VTGRDRAGLLRLMMLARTAEQRARSLVQGEADAAPAVRRHREAIGAGVAVALGPRDRLIAPGRYLAAHLGRGDDASVGASSAAPDLVPQAVGVAFALTARGAGDVVLTILDEGAMASERWGEALALATEMRLPLVLVVEQRPPPAANARAASVAGADEGLARQPLLGEAVDGDDPEAVLTAARAAMERARDGRGPTLVTCVAAADRSRRLRWGRGRADRRGRRKDPVESYARRLVRSGMPRAEIEAILLSAREEVAPWTR